MGKLINAIPTTVDDPNNKAQIIKTKWYYEHLQCVPYEGVNPVAIWGCCAKSVKKCYELDNKLYDIAKESNGFKLSVRTEVPGYWNSCRHPGYETHPIFCAVSTISDVDVHTAYKNQQCSTNSNYFGKFIAIDKRAEATINEGVKIMHRSGAAHHEYFDEYIYDDMNAENEEEINDDMDELTDLMFEEQILLKKERALTEQIEKNVIEQRLLNAMD